VCTQYVCVRVCIPCTFITPIARDPLFGLLHNRRRRRLRATYTHIMQVKMEPNQRGYTLHTQTLIQSGFLCFINPPPPSLAIEPKRAREKLATEKKRVEKITRRTTAVAVTLFCPLEKSPLERGTRCREEDDDRETTEVFGHSSSHIATCVCVYNERGGK